MRALAAAAAALAVLGGGVAQAGPARDLLVQHLESGRIAEAQTALDVRLRERPRDQETRYALGVAQYVGAFETLLQGLYRHGFGGPALGPQGLPAAAAVLPINPAPQPLSYAEFRTLLAAFGEDLDTATATLEGVTSTRVKLRLDLAAIRFDINADGRFDETDAAAAPGMFPTPAAILSSARTGAEPGATGGPFPVALDLADAIWLRGYANLINAHVDFAMAHDFSRFFGVMFPQLFAGVASPFDGVREGGLAGQQVFVAEASTLADVIAGLHEMRFAVVEPERRQRARTRLLQVVELSRANWRAILAERDDDAEWLPSPRQTTPFRGATITQARIDAWLGFLDTAEAVLEGRLLVPHWRFEQGIDMRAFFEEPRDLDVVLVASGHGITPYLRAGQVLKPQQLQRLPEAFGRNFFGFAAWFN